MHRAVPDSRAQTYEHQNDIRPLHMQPILRQTSNKKVNNTIVHISVPSCSALRLCMYACTKEQMNEQQHHNSILTSGTANRAEIELNMEIGESAPRCRMQIKID